MRKFGLLIGISMVVTLLFAANVSANGVSDQRLLFGQSVALNGPLADMGKRMRLGIEVAFVEANQAGGVHGRQLELLSLDDGYEPSSTMENTQRLLESDDVFALIGGVGTPTSLAAIPYAEAAGAPLIAPLSGAGQLRAPNLGVVINLRASYAQESERAIQHFVEEEGLTRVGVLFQDDTFGRSGLESVRAALLERGLSSAGEAAYKRNTVAVKRALLDLRSAQPEAVIIVGADKPAATFVRLAQEIGFAPRFLVLSFAANDMLLDALDGAGVGVLATQVVPLRVANAPVLVERFERAMADYAPSTPPDEVTLEGYLAGRFTIAVLSTLDGTPTRDAFLAAVRAGRVSEVDGFPLAFTMDDSQGSDAVYLSEIGPDHRFRAHSH